MLFENLHLFKYCKNKSYTTLIVQNLESFCMTYFQGAILRKQSRLINAITFQKCETFVSLSISFISFNHFQLVFFNFLQAHTLLLLQNVGQTSVLINCDSLFINWLESNHLFPQIKVGIYSFIWTWIELASLRISLCLDLSAKILCWVVLGQRTLYFAFCTTVNMWLLPAHY